MNHRVVQPELMDQQGLDECSHRQALAGLRRVNSISRTAQTLWTTMTQILRERQLASLTVLDLACGGGDVSLRLARMAKAQGLPMTFHGWDKSETAVALANATAHEAGIHNAGFFTRDVFSSENNEQYDIVMCTLFLHHLERIDALRFLKRMKVLARFTILIDDLYRSRFGYVMAVIGCHLLSRSPIVHFDGPASVKAAFTIEEASQLAIEAEMHGARFNRHWPERFLMQWNQP